jgi:hypothetical protein
VEKTEGTFGLYCVIVREAIQKSIDSDGTDSISNVAEHFKMLCAQRHIAYDSEIASKAIESVLAADARRRA